MRRFPLSLVLLTAGAGALAGCSQLDSYNRPYTWHPTGANTANIAAQVANPADLLVGRGGDRTDAAALVPGLRQVDRGLPNTPLGGGASSGAGAGAGGGAGLSTGAASTGGP